MKHSKGLVLLGKTLSKLEVTGSVFFCYEIESLVISSRNSKRF